MSSLRTIEQRQWELQQQENAYWHEMLVSGYQSRTYQMVSKSNGGASLMPHGQHRPKGAESQFRVFASAVMGLPMLYKHGKRCSRDTLKHGLA